MVRTSTWNHNKFRLKHMAALGHNDLTAGFTGIPSMAAASEKKKEEKKIRLSHRSLLKPVVASDANARAE